MRVALLTRAMPSANAFVRRLAGSAKLELVVVEGVPNSVPRATSLRGRVRSVLRRAEDALERTVEREHRALELVYGPLALPLGRTGEDLPPLFSMPPRGWASAIPALEAAEPDLIAVLGTSIVPEAVTRLAALGAVNIHAGLAPHYRGNRCIEHAILADDLDNVGVTLHVARPKIDAGEIVVQRRPRLEASDDEHIIFHRVLDAGERAFVELLGALEAGARLAARPQPKDVGTYYPVGAWSRGHARLVRRLVDGGAVARYVERRAAGRSREKPILEALQVEPREARDAEPREAAAREG